MVFHHSRIYLWHFKNIEILRHNRVEYLRLQPATSINMLCVYMCSGSLIDVSTTSTAKAQNGSGNSRKMFLHKVRYIMAVWMHGITAPCNIAIWRANGNYEHVIECTYLFINSFIACKRKVFISITNFYFR